MSNFISKFENFITENNSEDWWEKLLWEIKDVFQEYFDEDRVNSLQIGTYKIDETGKYQFNDFYMTKNLNRDFYNHQLSKGESPCFRLDIRLPLSNDKLTDQRSSEILINLETLNKFNFIDDSSRLKEDFDIFFNMGFSHHQYKPITIFFIPK